MYLSRRVAVIQTATAPCFEVDGAGGLDTVDLEVSNLVVDGEVRDLKLLRHVDGPLIVVGRNGDRVRVLRPSMMETF